MNPWLLIGGIGPALALAAFITAFLLTLWPNRTRAATAAVLYGYGTWSTLGSLVFSYSAMSQVSFGVDNSGSVSSSILTLLPAAIATLYALAAPLLLIPSIPQSTAMRYGRMLHVVLLPLLVISLFALAYTRYGGFLRDPMRWLVYGLLWFRIRESYGLAYELPSPPAEKI